MVSEVRKAIARALGALPGLRCYSTVPDQMSTPCAIVFGPEAITYDSTMAWGSDEMRLVVRLYVGRVDERGAQDHLDAYCSGSGPLSVKQAVEDDDTLGGAVDVVRVEQARGYGPYVSGATSYLGVEFVLFVLWRPNG